MLKIRVLAVKLGKSLKLLQVWLSKQQKYVSNISCQYMLGSALQVLCTNLHKKCLGSGHYLQVWVCGVCVEIHRRHNKLIQCSILYASPLKCCACQMDPSPPHNCDDMKLTSRVRLKVFVLLPKTIFSIENEFNKIYI